MPPPALQDLDGILLLCSCECGQIPYPSLNVVASLSQVRELQQKVLPEIPNKIMEISVWWCGQLSRGQNKAWAFFL